MKKSSYVLIVEYEGESRDVILCSSKPELALAKQRELLADLFRYYKKYRYFEKDYSIKDFYMDVDIYERLDCIMNGNTFKGKEYTIVKEYVFKEDKITVEKIDYLD